jgi:hypothetical protein
MCYTTEGTIFLLAILGGCLDVLPCALSEKQQKPRICGRIDMVLEVNQVIERFRPIEVDTVHTEDNIWSIVDLLLLVGNPARHILHPTSRVHQTK